MNLVAWGDCGFGDLIWETERGRPFGMSALKLSRRDSLREEEEECLSLDEEECLEEECFSFSECWRDELDLEDLLEDLYLGHRGCSRCGPSLAQWWMIVQGRVIRDIHR